MAVKQQSDLTSISGVGPATAEQIQNHGFSSAEELYVAYLGDEAEKVEDAVRSVEKLQDGIHDVPITAGDLDIYRETTHARAPVMFMSFARIFGLSSLCLKVETMGTLRSDNSNAKPDEIEWVGKNFGYPQFVGPNDVTQIVETEHASEIFKDYQDYEKFVEPMNVREYEHETDDGIVGAVWFDYDGVENVISGEYVEKVNRLYDRDYTDPQNSHLIRCKNEWSEIGESFNDESGDKNGSPVQFIDPDTGTSVWVAPRMIDYSED